MFLGLLLMGFPPEIALLLAGIAPASDPVATIDVIREVKGQGEFPQTLESVVGIDDAWGGSSCSVFYWPWLRRFTERERDGTLFSSAFGKLVEPYCWDSFWVSLWPI